MATANLSSCELFRGLDEAALDLLVAAGTRQTLPAGTVLFRMGEVAERLYVLLRGRVLLALPFRLHDTEQDLTVDEKVPQELVGWSALVPPHKSTMTARTLVDSELLMFPGRALLEKFEQEPRIGLKVMSNLAEVMGRRFHQAQALWMRELQRGVNKLHG